MRILHYISDLTNAAGPQASAARLMILATSRVAESHLVTLVRLPEETGRLLAEHGNVKVHYLAPHGGDKPAGMLSKGFALRGILREVRPDIVHIHGSWDSTAAIAEYMARRQNTVTIVSPHRGLSPAIVGIDFWKSKLPRLIAYQALMIRRCTAIAAVSEQERNDIINLGLKKRIEVMPPMPKAQETTQPLSDALMATYRKAADSNYHKFITKAEKDLVFAAVRAMVEDDDDAPNMPRMKVPGIKGLSFRRVYFYAYDEDVLPMTLNGCERLRLPIPPAMDVEAVPRYRNAKAKRRGALADVEATNIPCAITGDKPTEREAFLMLCRAQKLGFGRLTLRHYVELYSLFRHTDFNEDIVAAELKRTGKRKFTLRMQRRLAEMFALKPGYNIF